MYPNGRPLEEEEEEVIFSSGSVTTLQAILCPEICFEANCLNISIISTRD
jgi:hypothetical protein